MSVEFPSKQYMQSKSYVIGVLIELQTLLTDLETDLSSEIHEIKTGVSWLLVYAGDRCTSIVRFKEIYVLVYMRLTLL